MILLEFTNQIIIETITQQLAANQSDEKAGGVEIKCADFDAVQYHIWSHQDDANKLIISISWACFDELKAHGAEALLKSVYDKSVFPCESGYDFSLVVDLVALAGMADKAREEAITKFALFKRNALAAPFQKAFDAQTKGQTTGLMQVAYRSGEALWVQAQADRVTVIFKTTFKDEVDVIFGEVFLQEFADARRQPALQNSPQVLFYGDQKDPPVELASVKAIKQQGVGYVTFVLFPRHYDAKSRENTISLIETFRDYLHYHIKCSKAYMHSRMRARVAAFLKVLNRAKPDVVDKKKAGKKF